MTNPSPTSPAVGGHPSLTELERDMRERFHPTQAAVAHATALLEAEPRAELAYIPIYLPGKVYGWWELGQEVVTVPGVVLIAANSFEDAEDIPSGVWARDTAAAVARQELQRRKRGGVPGWAVVRRNGHVATFEDPL